MPSVVPQPRTLQDRIQNLNSELELANFLNKGVLQTNSELKLRIQELEIENKALRVAESQLARTEDALEAAERRLKERDREEGLKVEEWEELMKSEVEKRKGIEKERDRWKKMFEGLWMGLNGCMDELRMRMKDVEGKEVAPSEPLLSSHPLTRHRSRPHSIICPETSLTNPTTSNLSRNPTTVVRSSSQARKRRRVKETPEDDSNVIDGDVAQSPPPIRHSTPKHQPSTPKQYRPSTPKPRPSATGATTTTTTSSSTGGGGAPSSNRGQHRISDRNRSNLHRKSLPPRPPPQFEVEVDEEEFTVKVEPGMDSPRDYSDEDDPLAF